MAASVLPASWGEWGSGHPHRSLPLLVLRCKHLAGSLLHRDLGPLLSNLCLHWQMGILVVCWEPPKPMAAVQVSLLPQGQGE